MDSKKAEDKAKEELGWNKDDEILHNGTTKAHEARIARDKANLNPENEDLQNIAIKKEKEARESSDKSRKVVQKRIYIVKLENMKRSQTNKNLESDQNEEIFWREEEEKKYNAIKRIMQEKGVTEETAIEEYFDELDRYTTETRKEMLQVEAKERLLSDVEKISVINEKNNDKNIKRIDNKSVTKEDIMSSLDDWINILNEEPESIEEIYEKIEDLKDISLEENNILKNLTRDSDLVEALKSDEARDEYIEKILQIQEQIQENNIELSSEPDFKSTNIYSLLGISKITDKEMQPIYDASKDRISVDEQQQSQIVDSENSKPILTEQVDELYIVDGVVMKIDEKCSEIAIKAQEEGRNPEEALAQYFEEQELENNKESDRDGQEDIKVTNVNSGERTLGVQAEEIKTDDSNSIKYIGKTEESKRAILTEKDENGNVTKIKVLRPIQFLKKTSIDFQQNSSKTGVTIPLINAQQDLITELVREEQRGSSGPIQEEQRD